MNGKAQFNSPSEKIVDSDSDEAPAIPKYRRKVVSKIQNFVKTSGSARALKWCRYEWFYSEIDAGFFQHNEFQQLLNQKGLAHISELTRLEWSFVRSRLFGKPRRLSAKFMTEEREKLAEYRSNVRQVRTGGNPIPEVYIPCQIPQQIKQNTKVLVFDKNRFRGGSVLSAHNDESYSVQFDDQLGTQIIPEIDIMPIDLPSRAHHYINPLPDATQLAHATMPFSHEDLKNIALLVPVLEKKEILINELRVMNDQAERTNNQGEALSLQFRDQYAALLLRLDEVNRNLVPALAALRGRNTPAPPTQPVVDKAPQPTWLVEIQAKAASSAAMIVDHVRASSPHFKLEDKDRDWRVAQLIHNCLVFLLHIQACADTPMQPHHVNTALDTALHNIIHSDANKDLFGEIRTSVAVIKSELYKLAAGR